MRSAGFEPNHEQNGGATLNPKLQKITDEIKRTKAKIAELQALIPKLEKQKTELENAEVIKALRSADVKLSDFAAFIEAYHAGQIPAQVQQSAAPASAPHAVSEAGNERKVDHGKEN
jgi:chromosome segregation ATPase